MNRVEAEYTEPGNRWRLWAPTAVAVVVGLLVGLFVAGRTDSAMYTVIATNAAVLVGGFGTIYLFARNDEQ